MISFLIWYLLISLLGWITFPIAFRSLKQLPGRGFAFSKILGLVLWGFIFWLATSLGLFKNDISGQLTALLLLAVISFFLAWQDRFKSILTWIKANIRLILMVEGLFLLTFALWALIRSANPLIIGTEKPMEMAFINSILRSPTFPPNDPWLSGYGISYYYFGYVIIAMLIKVSGVSSGVGYNLSAALWFAMTAICAYGLVFDLTKAQWIQSLGNKSDDDGTPGWVYFAPLIAPVMILIVSNLHGFLDVLHARGAFWSPGVDGERTSVFWQWIRLKELNQPPASPLSWMPKRLGGVQWWGASRVLQDFNYLMSPVEIIDEFPFFSYLLSDLHPHVLAMPLVMMLIGFAFNTFRGGLDARGKLFGHELPFSPQAFLLIAVLIGGLMFMNTWDSPFYLALIAAAYLLRQYMKTGWSGRRILEFLAILVGVGILSVILYLPFFLGFDSQAGGVIPSLIFYTRGVYFWVMFAPLLVPVIIYLLMVWRNHKSDRSTKLALIVTFGLFGSLFILTWVASYLASKLPEIGAQFLWLQGAGEIGILPLLWEAIRRRLSDPLTWLTLGLMTFLGMGLIFPKRPETISDPEKPVKNPTAIFVVLLILLGTLLTLIPEFFYLRDQFSVRMNTIFKFYFQAWILWGLAGSVGIIQIWKKSGRWSIVSRITVGIAVVMILVGLSITISPNISGKIFDSQIINQDFGSLLQDWLFAGALLFLLILGLIELIKQHWLRSIRVLIIVMLILGMLYPVIAMWNKVGIFPPLKELTLDGTDYYRLVNSDQMTAVDWLADAPLGVMVEAVSPSGGSYSGYARISTFSGMPTVLGWIGHVLQWRGGGEEMGSRQSDIKTLYSTSSWDDAKDIIKAYNIRYIYIGDLERSTYQLQDEKFDENLQLVYQNNSVKIYEVPTSN